MQLVHAHTDGLDFRRDGLDQQQHLVRGLYRLVPTIDGVNAANEVAVASFLAGHCSFPSIWQTVEAVMGAHRSIAGADLDAILTADAWARNYATSLLT